MSNTTTNTSGFRWAAVNDTGHVIGSNHPRAKLSDADIDLMIALRAAGMSYGRIAAKFDGDPHVSKSMVFYVCNDLRRAQTVMGHKRIAPPNPTFQPAGIDEFEVA